MFTSKIQSWSQGTHIASGFRTGTPVEASERCNAVHSDRKSTRLNSSHSQISYAVFCLKKKTIDTCSLQGFQLLSMPPPFSQPTTLWTYCRSHCRWHTLTTLAFTPHLMPLTTTA